MRHNLEVKDRAADWTLTRPERSRSDASSALGDRCHQPPVYYGRECRIASGAETGPKPEARFRLEQKD